MDASYLQLSHDKHEDWLVLKNKEITGADKNIPVLVISIFDMQFKRAGCLCIWVWCARRAFLGVARLC
jgi:hypothetical protein